VATMRGDKRK